MQLLLNFQHPIFIPYVDSRKTFSPSNQIWGYSANYLRNYTHSNFWASIVKFILKCQTSFPDGLSFLNVAEKALEQISWNFGYTFLKLFGINVW